MQRLPIWCYNFTINEGFSENKFYCTSFSLVTQETIATVAGDGSGDGLNKALTVFMCEECNSVFLNQDTLAVHILAEHMPKGTYLSAGKLARVSYLLYPE